MIRKSFGWIAVAAALGISLLAASPWWPRGMVASVPGQDKTGHFVLVGLLAAACVLAFAGRTLRGRRMGSGAVLALVALAVTVDEFAQALVPTRTFDPLDLVMSWAGIAVLGGLAAWAVARREP